jgi:hypothetical protein
MTESLARALRAAAQFAACRAHVVMENRRMAQIVRRLSAFGAARFGEALLEHFGPAVARSALGSS